VGRWHVDKLSAMGYSYRMDANEKSQVGDSLNSWEQLEALPALTVVRDGEGDVAEKQKERGWLVAGYEDAMSGYMLAYPVTVLHLPEGDTK
jgi:hypothetical protein